VQLLVRGKNVEVSEELSSYAETKLAKVTEQLPTEVAVELDLSQEGKSQSLAEVSVFAKGQTLRASEGGKTLRAAIDQVDANLDRQVVRYREKRRIEPRRRAPHHE